MNKTSEEIVREIKALKNKLAGKFELTEGVRIWGKTASDVMKVVRVNDDGELTTVNP